MKKILIVIAIFLLMVSGVWGFSFPPGSAHLSTVSSDSSPELGGDLDANGYKIGGVYHTSSDLNALVTAISSTPATVICADSNTLTANLTIPATMKLIAQKGCMITKASTYTATFNGPVEAGNYQWLSGFSSGDVTFASGMVNAVHPEWWGTGTGDDALSINKAINAMSGPVNVVLNGNYNTNTTILADKDRVHLLGSGGNHTATITFSPTTSGDPAVKFIKSAAVNYQSSIKDITFVGSGTKQKIAIEAVDTSGLIIENVTAYPWTGNNSNPATPSTFLLTKGREALWVKDIYVSADLPIHIADNPNSTLDLDHAHFENLYLTVTDATQYNVLIDDSVNLSNITFDGIQAWAQGKGGLYFSSAGASANLNISLDNIRFEQPTSTGGWLIYWQASTYNLTVKNIYGGDGVAGAGINGYNFKNVLKADIGNTAYIGTGIALQLHSVYDFNTTACFWFENSTINLDSSVKEIISMPKYSSSQPGSGTAFYSSESAYNGGINFSGIQTWNVADSSVVLDTNGVLVKQAGQIGIGTQNADSAFTIQSNKPRGIEISGASMTGSADTIGLRLNPTTYSDVTGSHTNIISMGGNTAASYTLGTWTGAWLLDVVKGAGSTITNQYGLRIGNLSSATNNYGLASEVSAGVNKYNLYISGTAPNYMAGNLTVGGNSIDTPQAVTGTDTGDGSARAITVTPTSSYIQLSCNDTSGGCTGTMSESGATSGQTVKIECMTAYVTAFADSAGVQELPGNSTFSCDTGKTIKFTYNGSAWIADDGGIVSTAIAAGKSTNLVGGNPTTLKGSIPYQSDTDGTSMLAPNVTTTKKFVTETGTGTNGNAPVFDVVIASDVVNTPAGNISSTNQQDVNAELDAEKMQKATYDADADGKIDDGALLITVRNGTWTANDDTAAGFPRRSILFDYSTGHWHVKKSTTGDTGAAVWIDQSRPEMASGYWCVGQGAGLPCVPTNVLSLSSISDTVTFEDADAVTKKFRFDASPVTAGQTRVFLVPDADGTVCTIAAAQEFTNKTFNTSATGNVFQATNYVILSHPHLCSAGAPIQTTSTSNTYGQCKFGNATDKATNYAEYYFVVPSDIDTAVDLTATFKIQLSNADTGDHEYEISFDSVANSAAYAGSLGDPISLAYTADGSGASGDVETAGTTTLTGWRSALTAGQLMVIRVARDGDHANDSSTADSYSGPLVISYGITQ